MGYCTRVAMSSPPFTAVVIDCVYAVSSWLLGPADTTHTAFLVPPPAACVPWVVSIRPTLIASRLFHASAPTPDERYGPFQPKLAVAVFIVYAGALAISW